MFGCMNRLSILAILFFGMGSAVMTAVIVLSTEGLGGSDIINLPVQSTVTAERTTIEETAPGRLNDVVEKREIFQEVPRPSEVSTDSPVIVTNVSLAIIFALLFGLLSTMLNNLIRDQEKELQAWLMYFYLDRIFFPLRAARFIAGQDVKRGCLGGPIIIIIFAIYGIVFAFLEPGLNLLSPAGIQLAIVLAISVGVISLAGDVARRQVARFWHKTARFGMYPANVTIAAFTTVLSRLFGLSPGILFGTPGGVDVEGMEDEPRLRDAVLAMTTLAVVLVFGALGWAMTELLWSAGDQTLSGDQLEFVAPLSQLGLALGLALFVVAIETAFFEMVPVSLTMGTQVFRWNPLVWAIGFIPVLFVFSHTLLNPQGEYLEAFEQTPVILLTIAVILMVLFLGILWILFRFFDPPNLRRPPPPPYGGGRPPYQQPGHLPPYQGYPPQQPPYQPPRPPQGYPPPQRPPQGYPPPQRPPQPPPRRNNPPRR